MVALPTGPGEALSDGFLDEQNIMRFVFPFTIYIIGVCHTLTAAGMPEPA